MGPMITLVTIVGARPQIIKASALSRAFASVPGQLREIIVHTGQHYDDKLSPALFAELGLPAPALNLEAGSGSHAEQTARMLPGLERFLQEVKPDGVLLYGDTNSTLAGALVAARLYIPVIHVEAGLRSEEKNMPEEVNRRCTDRVSSLLFAPTQRAVDNLLREGFSMGGSHKPDAAHPAVFLSGDVMLDNQRHFLQSLTEARPVGKRADGPVLVTFHRESNTRDPQKLKAIASALIRLARNGQKLILPLHPRTLNSFQQLGQEGLLRELREQPGITVSGPLSYLELLPVLRDCSLVITDSGGVQKEAFFLGKPVLILRENTEWQEIVDSGWGLTCQVDEESIITAFEILRWSQQLQPPDFFGDGHAAEHIRDLILQYL